MRKRSHCASAMALACAFLPHFVAAQPVKLPVDRQKAQKLVDELYGDDIRQAGKDPVAQARLASQLLQEAKETTDLPAARLILLETALALASEAGDLAVALQALEEKSQGVGPASSPEVVAEKVRVLARAAEGARTAETQHVVVDTALVLVEDALAADDYVAGRTLLELAEKAALRLKSVALVSGVRRRLDEVLRGEE